ncbi:hypothetical protein HB780_06065 (plasmid) [Rhizobium lusitanum]|uniref:PBECR2 nuclease fold domain-containing protein n=1 Tax=Rhizobium lusitanum TaxID=293958 RepID=UPI001622BB28|nr:PBECR2 nuclease fold domain-containing protein [Rhizobium lusitanum]QND45313.1 hypothetical protein HB780_06065 [Rhizobium lusitanum]
MADQLPFQEAIDFLRNKVNLPTKRWDDVMRQGQVRGFTVAGIARDDMLSDFMAALLTARTAGTGFNEFRKTFDEIVDRTGWKFNAKGGTDEERHEWRAGIIYRTNMRTSYMAGRWKQLTDPDVLKYRPYLQYVHSRALHPRLLHLHWDGLVLATIDPAWRYMFPPNGWGCGCDVKALSERDLKRLGKSGPDEAPDLTPYESVDPRTGYPELRYPGIDRGWDYNVGEEWLSGIVPTELRQPLAPADAVPQQRSLPPLPPETKADPTEVLPADRGPDEYASAFLSRFGLQGDEKGYYRDPSGGIIAISKALFEQRMPDGTVVGLKSGKRGRGQYAALLADAIREPDEIWVDWASVKSGIVLRRAYLKRVLLPDGKSLFLRFEWTKAGWTAITGFDTTDSYIQGFRKGALLYRKK